MDNEIRQKYEKKMVRKQVRFLKDTEYIQLVKRAKECGYKEKGVNKFIKEIALNGKIVIKKAELKEVEEGKRILFQMRKMGNNFNQITRLVNEKQGQNLSNESRNILYQLEEIKEMMFVIEKVYRKRQ